MGFAALDTETTGLEDSDHVVEVAVVQYDSDGTEENRWSTLINPGVPISKSASNIHGITDKDVQDAPSFAEIYSTLVELVRGRTPVVFNLPFDYRMLKNETVRCRKPWFGFFGIDPLVLARKLWPNLLSYAQDKLTRDLGIHDGTVDHRALEDTARTGALLFGPMREKFGNTPMTIGQFWERQVELALLHERTMLIKRRGKPTSTPWHTYLGVPRP